jgi:hypothetical protein
MKSVIVLSFRIIQTLLLSYLLKPKRKPEKGLNITRSWPGLRTGRAILLRPLAVPGQQP